MTEVNVITAKQDVPLKQGAATIGGEVGGGTSHLGPKARCRFA